MQSHRIFKILTFFATSSCVGLMTLDMMGADFTGRNCVTAVQCVFEARRNVRVYLDCQNGHCVCKNYGLIADVPVWDLKENESGKCSIDEGGPCGRDKGLDISCASSYECVESRCRARAKIGTHKLGQVCLDDIDCQQGLQCVVTSFYFQATKSCVNPKSTEHDDDDDKPMVATTTTRKTTTTTVQPPAPVSTTTTTKSVQLINQSETDSSGDGRNSTNTIMMSTKKSNESDLLDVGDEDDSPKISSNKVSSSSTTFTTFPILLVIFCQTVFTCARL